MKRLGILVIVICILPSIGFSQLKKDVTKPNISKSLEVYNPQDALVGFLDPSRFHMSHSFSMSYMTFGGGGAMVNSYINTLNYMFSDNLFLTTKLGIMNSPINSLPGNNYLNDMEFFGGAELKYLPSENSAITLRIEKMPSFYSGYNSYNHYRSPFGFTGTKW
jgi:hypothetical protein